MKRVPPSDWSNSNRPPSASDKDRASESPSRPVPERLIGPEAPCGDLTVDLSVRRCLLAGHEVTLRSKEFDLLWRLTSAAGQALSRETLMSDVWGPNWFGSTKTLDVHVAAVRRRLSLAAAAQSPPVTVPEITTLRRFGYRMERPRVDKPGAPRP